MVCTYHHFYLLVCTGASGIRFWPVGVDFGSMLVDFRIRESTLGALSQCVARGADFVQLGFSIGGCKNIIITFDNFAKKTAKLQYTIKKPVIYLQITRSYQLKTQIDF